MVLTNEPNGGETATPQNRGRGLWSAVGGAVVGAAIVGAIWGLTGAGRGASDARIASIDGHTISQSTLNNALTSRFGQQQLQQMIDDQLVTTAAKAGKFTATAADISAAETGIEAQYGISGTAQLASFLQANGLTESQFRAILKNQVLEQKIAESGVTVTNKQIQSYYNANKSQFTPIGSKKPSPLSQVRGQVETDLKVAGAPSAAQELATLAKKYHLNIYDKKYKSVLATIENVPATVGTAPGTATAGG